jgi:hypothetical protein
VLRVGVSLFWWEYCSAALIGALLISIATSAFFGAHRHEEESVPIFVRVVGAVKQECELMLPPSATMADVLARVELTEAADRDNLRLDDGVYRSWVIIPTKACVSVLMTGSIIKNRLVTLPEGSRFYELEHCLDLDASIDLRFFRRKKRLLQDGEVIVVPATSGSRTCRGHACEKSRDLR